MSGQLATPLCEALARCRSAATLIAPYIKGAAMSRLLEFLTADVKLTVVTRWRPMEVALGVSDLGVYEQCAARQGARLFLLDALHAKYYRADDCVFIGSANLTGAGMGWSSSPNVEILHPASNDETWRRFEERVIARAVIATQDLRESVQSAADSLRPLATLRSASDPGIGVSLDTTAPIGSRWLPLSRSPEGLRHCYFGRTELVSVAAMSAGQFDMSVLHLPNGLADDQFTCCVRAALLQQPCVDVLRRITRDAPRFGELKARIREQFSEELDGRDPEEVTQTLMRWATWFLSDLFRIRVHRFTEHLESRG